MNPPKWAQELALNALIYLESKGLEAETPVINWRHGNRESSSGTCFHVCQGQPSPHIAITAGTDKRDAKLVLLHELTHWVMPLGECHGDNFWQTAFDLFQWARLPQRVCLSREAGVGRSHKRLKKLQGEVKRDA